MNEFINAVTSSLTGKDEEEVALIFNDGMERIRRNQTLMSLLIVNKKLSWEKGYYVLTDCQLYFKIIEIGLAEEKDAEMLVNSLRQSLEN